MGAFVDYNVVVFSMSLHVYGLETTIMYEYTHPIRYYHTATAQEMEASNPYFSKDSFDPLLPHGPVDG
ncbi:hypothetical protein L249_6163 [Ophiocordyceps polyrhachis-furcata BCC 54312]|uniref:Uncharacterized protein n=1 Tax=Ophiocordyceps polyrhachis-furcata BCC 54312 TaxID=1330021 RepID=A0A367LJ73_9HYPO|nr:hypothetical protein L249_6163 [Ophiocordyceps polyrhachis-furcata BCC 54312]